MEIQGKNLIVSGHLDHETQPVIQIEIRVMDSGNPAMAYDKSFNITVSDLNEAPTDLNVTMHPVYENNTVDQIVANLKIVDEDRDQQVQSCVLIDYQDYFYFANDTSGAAMNMLTNKSARLDYETMPVINGKKNNEDYFLSTYFMVGF